MEFRILGPLEVRAGDHTIPLRGRKQRALLAFLLINVNQVIADDRLLEELWREDAPESGTTALRVRISQLRKALGPGAIATRSPGYALDIDPEQIDARRFERLLDEGRNALAEGDPDSAAGLLREGLALWRGPALMELSDEGFARTEVARLEELRVAALEERVEADLALGRHRHLVGELEAVLPDHPFRERLREQLMIALYRSGRQTDALAAYRSACTTMRDELGIEPGLPLRRLEQAILHQESWLSAPLRTPFKPPSPDEERKLVTVLAAGVIVPDETVDPERAAALQQRIRAELHAELETSGATIEAAVGSTTVAAFGVPVAQEDHCERAIGTALSIRRRFSEIFGEAVSVRIGLDTGEVIVTPERDTPRMAGPPLATAMRLQHNSGAGEILTGEKTIAGSRGAFEFGTPRLIAEALPSRRCRPVERELSVTRLAVTHNSPLVGRDAELQLLRTAFRHVVGESKAHLVSIVGEAGIGKSRLVLEFWSWLANELPEPARRVGRCLPYGRGLTYRPLADVLREQLGIRATDPPEEALRRLEPRPVLGLTLGLDVLADLHPLAARERLHEGWVQLLGELAAERPVVLLIEDLHWAQAPLLDLLGLIARDVGGPVLIVTTARPAPPGGPSIKSDDRDSPTIRLTPLSGDETDRLLVAVSPKVVPAELRRQIAERSGGNPFFAEEMLASQVDESASGGPGPTVSFPPLPESVLAVLAARIDRLPPTEKAALQAASIIGRNFWRGAVRRLLEGDLPDFGLLEKRDFVRPRWPSFFAGEHEFAFKHALTREAAYAMVSKKRRARLHALFAGWLEGTVGSRDEHAPFLAHHYFEATKPEDSDIAWADQDELDLLRKKAVAWLRKAAELSIRRYELDEAIALLQRAETLGPSEGERCELWRAVGRAHALRFDGGAFRHALEQAIELAPSGRVRGAIYADLAFEACNRWGMWAQRPATEHVDSWIEGALELVDEDSPAQVRALVGKAFTDPESGMGAAEKASSIAERLDDPELLAAAWDARRLVNMVAGDYEAEIAWAERRFELLDRSSDPDRNADILMVPIPAYIRAGRVNDARRLARRHDEVTRSLTSHQRVHGAAVLLEVEEAAGEWNAIGRLVERTEKVVAANSATPCVRNARSLLVCAAAEAYLGNEDRAGMLEESAETIALDGFGHVLDTPRIRLALARGDRERLEALVACWQPSAREHVLGRGFTMLSRTTRLDALTALGDHKRAEKEAEAMLEAGPYPRSFAMRALGVARADRALIERALDGFNALGLTWHAIQTRKILETATADPLHVRQGR